MPFADYTLLESERGLNSSSKFQLQIKVCVYMKFTDSDIHLQ